MGILISGNTRLLKRRTRFEENKTDYFTTKLIITTIVFIYIYIYIAQVKGIYDHLRIAKGYERYLSKMNFTRLFRDGVTLRCNVDRDFSTAILTASRDEVDC